MKYMYWVGAVLVISLGIIFALSFSWVAPSVSKIEFTQVETPEEFGQKVFEFLREELAETPLILFGVTPNYIEDMELIRGFVEATDEEGLKYDFFVIEPELPYVELFFSNLRADMKNEMDFYAEGIREALQQGRRVISILHNIYSSKLISGNPADRFREYGFDFISISVTKFPSTRQQELEFEPRCILDPQQDRSRLGTLGCAIQEASRKTYSKNIEKNKFSGMMEETGAGDYLILFNRNPSTR